jgi:hypothetical protein
MDKEIVFISYFNTSSGPGPLSPLRDTKVSLIYCSPTSLAQALHCWLEGPWPFPWELHSIRTPWAERESWCTISGVKLSSVELRTSVFAKDRASIMRWPSTGLGEVSNGLNCAQGQLKKLCHYIIRSLPGKFWPRRSGSLIQIPV